MNKLHAIAVAIGLVGSLGSLSVGVATADTAFAVGGARPPGVPWYEFTNHLGRGFYPDASPVIVDYPGGVVDQVLPPGVPGVGESVVIGTRNLDAAIRGSNGTGSNVAIGLSEGSMVLGAAQALLATDPTAPRPDQLSFAMFGSPVGSHGFGKSFLSTYFQPGTPLPFLDYSMPVPVDSQYDTTKVVAAYDGLADFPDRPNLVSVANAVMGVATGHTPAAFSSPANVPPQNITTSTNGRGAAVTTYLVPNKYLPLTTPLRYLGLDEQMIDQIDLVLKPIVEAGYSRNDNPGAAPVAVDPVVGADPIQLLGTAVPAVADIGRLAQQAQGLLLGGLG